MSEERIVTATLVVDFTAPTADTGTGALVLELDDRDPPAGLNGGKTGSDFRPGDSVGYLLFCADNVTLRLHRSTSGGIVAAGGGSKIVEEFLVFADARESGLRYPVSGGFSAEWIGESAGSASLATQTSVTIPDNGFGILRVTYHAFFRAFRLTGVPLTVPKVMIYAAGAVNA